MNQKEIENFYENALIDYFVYIDTYKKLIKCIDDTWSLKVVLAYASQNDTKYLLPGRSVEASIFILCVT